MAIKFLDWFQELPKGIQALIAIPIAIAALAASLAPLLLGGGLAGGVGNALSIIPKLGETGGFTAALVSLLGKFGSFAGGIFKIFAVFELVKGAWDVANGEIKSGIGNILTGIGGLIALEGGPLGFAIGVPLIAIGQFMKYSSEIDAQIEEFKTKYGIDENWARKLYITPEFQETITPDMSLDQIAVAGELFKSQKTKEAMQSPFGFSSQMTSGNVEIGKNANISMDRLTQMSSTAIPTFGSAFANANTTGLVPINESMVKFNDATSTWVLASPSVQTNLTTETDLRNANALAIEKENTALEKQNKLKGSKSNVQASSYVNPAPKNWISAKQYIQGGTTYTVG
jgi:hypothetical protein